MAFTEVLRMLLVADTDGAVRSIENLGRATDKSLSKSQQNLDKLGRGLTVAGAGMVAFGAAGLLGLGKAAQASEEANLAVVKLENTLGNMPKLAGENSKQFIDLAEAIQDKTAADADAIVEAQALLGTFQLTADQIKQITPLIVDYSRKFGVDLPSAAVQVGKALDGNIGALKRVGISIDETAFAADRFGAVQSALSEQVGGFAEAEGKTFAGSLERLKNQLGDVAEGVGVGAVDAFSSLFNVVGGGIDRIKELSPATQEAIGKFATFGSVALIAAGGLSFTIGQLLKMATNFRIARDAVTSFIGVGGLGGLAKTLAKGGVIIGGLIALDEALDAALGDTGPQEANLTKLNSALREFGESGKVGGELAEVVGENFDKLRGAFGTLNDPGLLKGAESAIDTFSEKVTFGLNDQTTEVEKAQQKFEDFDAALAEIAASNPEAAFDILKAAAGELGVSVDDLKGRLPGYSDEVDRAKQSAADAGTSVDEFGVAISDSAEETEEAVSALQAYSDHLRGLTDPLFAAMDAITGVRDAQLAEKDAIAAVMEAQAALNEARAAGDPEAVAEAERGLADAQRELTDAQWQTVQSAAQADSALAGLKDAVDRGDVSVAEFRSTLQTWVRQGFLTQDQADRAAGSVRNLAGAADEADRKRIDIPVTVRTGDAHNTIRVLQQRIDSLTGRTVTVSVVASYTASASNALQTFGGRQAGGGVVPRYMQSGGVNWNWGRGPRGTDTVPAWLTPGEMVLNQSQQANLFNLLASGAQFGGGGYVDNRTVVYEIRSNDPAAVVEAIKKYERRNGTGWRN